MDTVPCPFCAHASPLLFRVGDLNRRLSNETFPYYRCPQCRLVFLFPHPSNLGKYYPQEYYGSTRTLADLEEDLAAETYKIRLVHQFATSGRLLEVGPSRGAFAYLAKQGGFQVSAIERDAECCRFLSEVLGVETVNHVNPIVALESLQPFDVIALWQVIEHLGDPWRFIEAAAAKLNPGGHLILGAPNPASIQFRLFGRYWAHLDAPRHLQLIPAELLVRLGSRLGLESVMLNSIGDGDLDRNNLFGWRRSLLNLLHRRTAWGSFMHLNTGRFAYRLRRYEQAKMRGCTYTLVLRKTKRD